MAPFKMVAVDQVINDNYIFLIHVFLFARKYVLVSAFAMYRNHS